MGLLTTYYNDSGNYSSGEVMSIKSRSGHSLVVNLNRLWGLDRRHPFPPTIHCYDDEYTIVCSFTDQPLPNWENWGYQYDTQWVQPIPELAALTAAVASGECPPEPLLDALREHDDCPPELSRLIEELLSCGD